MLDSHPHHAEAKPETSASGINPAPRPNRSRLIAIVAVLVAVGIAITGILSRRHQESEVAKWTTELAVPVVATVTPKRGVTGQQVSLPGDIEAWFEAPIYARVSGYLKAWYFDFGAHVEKGQLLAEIDAPDLDAQLAAAKARLASAEAQVKVTRGRAQFCRDDLCALARLAEGRRFRAGDRIKEGGIRQRRCALQGIPRRGQRQSEPGRSTHGAGSLQTHRGAIRRHRDLSAPPTSAP